MTDLEELKKMAEAAGLDGWIASGWAQGDRGFEVYRRGTHDRVCADMVQSVAHFIAAANPQTVLALIRELEEARRDAEQANAENATMRTGIEEAGKLNSRLFDDIEQLKQESRNNAEVAYSRGWLDRADLDAARQQKGEDRTIVFENPSYAEWLAKNGKQKG